MSVKNLPRLVTALQLDASNFNENLLKAEMTALQAATRIQTTLDKLHLNLGPGLVAALQLMSQSTIALQSSLSGFNRQVQQLNTSLQGSNKQFTQVSNSITKMDQQAQQAKKSVRDLGVGWSNFLDIAIFSVGLGFVFRLVDAITAIPGALLEAEQNIYKMNRAFEVVYKTPTVAARQLAGQREMFQEYGARETGITGGPLRLAIAAKNASLTEQQISEMQVSLLAISKGLALTDSELGSIYKVFIQILSKQQVYAEEIIQQLAEYMPAVSIFAKVMQEAGLMPAGLKTAREEAVALRKMMEEGAVPMEAVYLVVKRLNKEFGVTPDKIKDTESEVSRLTNSWIHFAEALARDTGFGEAYRNVIKGLTSIMDTWTAYSNWSNNLRKENPELDFITTHPFVRGYRAVSGMLFDQSPAERSRERAAEQTFINLETARLTTAFREIAESPEVKAAKTAALLWDDAQLNEALQKWDKAFRDTKEGLNTVLMNMQGKPQQEVKSLAETFLMSRTETMKKRVDEVIKYYGQVIETLQRAITRVDELSAAQEKHRKALAAYEILRPTLGEEAYSEGVNAATSELNEAINLENKRNATIQDRIRAIEAVNILTEKELELVNKLSVIQGYDDLIKKIEEYGAALGEMRERYRLFREYPETNQFQLGEAYSLSEQVNRSVEQIRRALQSDNTVQLIGQEFSKLYQQWQAEQAKVMAEGLKRGIDVAETIRQIGVTYTAKIADVRYDAFRRLGRDVADISEGDFGQRVYQALPSISLPPNLENVEAAARATKNMGLLNSLQAVRQLVAELEKAQTLASQFAYSPKAMEAYTKASNAASEAVSNFNEKLEAHQITLQDATNSIGPQQKALAEYVQTIRNVIALQLEQGRTQEWVSSKIDEAQELLKSKVDPAYKDYLDTVHSLVQGVQSSIEEGIFSFMQNGFDTLGQSFERMLQQMAAQIIAKQLGTLLFGDLLNSASGTMPSAGNSGWMGQAFSFAAQAFSSFTMHGGGTYKDVARLHSGYNFPRIRSDEFPAVLKKDETVFTKGQMEQLGRGVNVVMNIMQPVDSKGLRTNSRQLAASIQRELLVAYRREAGR